MASGHFIDPDLKFHGGGVAAPVGTTANMLVDTGALEAAKSTGNDALACLNFIHAGASSMISVIQVYKNERGSPKETSRERRDDSVERKAHRSGKKNGRCGRDKSYPKKQSNHHVTSVARNEQRLTQSREKAAIAAVIDELDYRVSLFRNFLTEYQHDPSRWAEETKIFQRDISTFLKRLSNTMFRSSIRLNAMRVWANGALLHLKILSYMTSFGFQSTESHAIAVEIHRETARNLCSEYRRFNQHQSLVDEIQEVENQFHCPSNSVDYLTSRSNNVNISEVDDYSNEVGDETTGSRSHENEAQTPCTILVKKCGDYFGWQR